MGNMDWTNVTKIKVKKQSNYRMLEGQPSTCKNRTTVAVFELLAVIIHTFTKNTVNLLQILHGLNYRVCFIVLSKFFASGLSILVMGISTIALRSACCNAVTISKIGLWL